MPASGSSIKFETGNPEIERMIIDENGNVGIGTNNPQTKLAVNGVVLSEEVIVYTDISQYPDYVFDDDYLLISLKELEAFIDKNGHLPDIPTAKDSAEGIKFRRNEH